MEHTEGLAAPRVRGSRTGRRDGTRPLRRAIAVAAVAVVALGGCAHFNPAAFHDNIALYEASLREFHRGNFERAQQGLQKLTYDLTARDSLFALSRFYLAETYFGTRDFVTASREFRRVADEAPESPLAPTALLRAGDSFAELWRRPELDPTSGQTALATWQELQGRYPDSEASAISYIRVRGLNERFARKSYENGLFYFKRGGYDSAILYLRDLITTYPSSVLVPDAFVTLVRSYRAIGYKEELQETCDHLAQYYPNRRDVREACGNGRPGR
ncbi:MAG: outer membrane protein assembly factor BamD [Gemmatimonadales bacterium]